MVASIVETCSLTAYSLILIMMSLRTVAMFIWLASSVVLGFNLAEVSKFNIMSKRDDVNPRTNSASGRRNFCESFLGVTVKSLRAASNMIILT